MMAARFRSVTWVAVALVPALGCYLVTQYVAAERAQLARVEAQIGHSRKAIRDLETELGTRGSMAQLERWNSQTLALAAPTAQQFINGDVQLASLTALPALPRPAIATVPSTTAVAGDMRQAALTTPAAPVAAAPAGVRQAAFVPAPKPHDEPARAVSFARVKEAAEPASPIRQAAFKPAKRAAPEPETEAQPLLRQATYSKPPRDQVRQATTKVAMLSSGPLDSGTLADIGRIARSERGSRRP